MQQTRQLLPLVGILLAGCASAPSAKLIADYPKEALERGQG